MSDPMIMRGSSLHALIEKMDAMNLKPEPYTPGNPASEIRFFHNRFIGDILCPKCHHKGIATLNTGDHTHGECVECDWQGFIAGVIK